MKSNISNSDTPSIYYQTLRNELLILFKRNFRIIKFELFDIQFKFKSKISLIFNYWKADNQNEFMAITIHYVNKDWKLISRLIDMKLLEEPYSTDYLLEVLNRVLTYLDI